MIREANIPKPLNTELFPISGDTEDIVARVLIVFHQSKNQLKKFAPELKGETIKETCNNIWNWVKENIKYRKDPPGVQWIKTPARLASDGSGDCKSYSVFIASCLYNLGIKGTFRFVSYDKTDPTPTHVYVVVKSRGEEIIIDDVMPAFNREKAYASKFDYNMTRISTMAGIGEISGGLATTLNKAGRRKVFNNALPGLAILALYQFIPAGPKVEPGFESLANIMGSSDDLLSTCPAIIRQKRRLSLLTFWDIGGWADWNVGVEVFPKLKTQLTSMLGMDPQDWWRKKLQPQSSGYITGTEDEEEGGGKSGLISSIFGAIKGLFGNTDLQWRRGAPETWGPSESDWSGHPTNPVRNLPLGYDPATGTVYKLPVNNNGDGYGGNGNQNANYPPAQQPNNTLLYVGLGVLALLFLKK